MKTTRVSETFGRFEAALDRALEKAGPAPAEKYRIVTKNDGWALEECVVTCAGRWEWKQQYFSRNLRSVQDALKRRSL